MAFFTALLGALSAIPQILAELQLIRQQFEKANANAFLLSSTQAQQAIAGAKTEQDFKDAAAKLNATLNKL